MLKLKEVVVEGYFEGDIECSEKILLSDSKMIGKLKELMKDNSKEIKEEFSRKFPIVKELMLEHALNVEKMLRARTKVLDKHKGDLIKSTLDKLNNDLTSLMILNKNYKELLETIKEFEKSLIN